jgi:hypothetical protein
MVVLIIAVRVVRIVHLRAIISSELTVPFTTVIIDLRAILYGILYLLDR